MSWQLSLPVLLLRVLRSLASSLVLSGLFLLLSATLLSGCGGGGTVPGSGVELRSLSTELTSRKAVAYSPFRSSNRDTETVTRAMVLEDLQLLVKAGIGVIRLFDSSNAVSALTLQVIEEQNLPLKVMLGMYVMPNAETANQAELARGIALANAHPNTVVALSVGNETLVSWSFVPQSVATMAGYLRQVRQAVRQPVTTDDNWAFFAATQGVNPPKEVLDQIDFVSMHSYPLLDTIHNPTLWNWQQTSVPADQRAAAMADAAVARVQVEYTAVRSHLDGQGYRKMPVLIGETGWKAAPSGGESSRAHPVNQKMYFDRLEAWKASGSGPVNIIHFEAFDEPWKQGDDKWGLFNVQRQARCVVQGLDASFVAEAGSCDASAALYYVAPTSGGQVSTNRYTVYAEGLTSGEARPSATVALNAWENGLTANAVEVDESSGDGAKAMRVTPAPQVWGWGMTWTLSGAEVDLSLFSSSSATLNFRIRTDYPGQLEVGFFTGGTADGSAWDVYLPIASGQYGYRNDGQWCNVSIPVSALVARGAMAFGMTNPALSRLQMDRVSNVLVIADRYAVTGKAQGAGHVNPILIDDIHWSR
jgi:exo-beta-1,3-glucanase (GH17 family)